MHQSVKFDSMSILRRIYVEVCFQDLKCYAVMPFSHHGKKCCVYTAKREKETGCLMCKSIQNQLILAGRTVLGLKMM